ncbi:c-type cytochrome [Novosphingobium sp. 9]|uniref:c-type cytochrome n=1 Tax=Novosphingobium sp. 9 TaxID=2025349 RepID=UPI0021B62645|nr:c-type cytochrome [Novosphingobium sp. 9]
MTLKLLRPALAPLAALALLAGCGGGNASSSQDSEDDAAQDTAPAPVAAAGAPAGFAVCQSCHSVQAGVNSVGPSLAGIYGSKAGAVPGYSFSPALANSGIVWDEKSLDTWLQGPMQMVPGTKMVISVSDPARRKAVIAYLKTLK